MDNEEILTEAINENDLEKVIVAIEKMGIYIHDVPSLQLASFNGNIEIMDYLYEHAKKIREPFNWASKGEALAEAARSGSIEAVKYLINKKADVNYIDDRPLRAAEECGNIEIAKLLIDHGAEEALNIKTYKGINVSDIYEFIKINKSLFLECYDGGEITLHEIQKRKIEIYIYGEEYAVITISPKHIYYYSGDKSHLCCFDGVVKRLIFENGLEKEIVDKDKTKIFKI